MFANTRRITALTVALIVAALAVATALPGIAVAGEPAAPYTTQLSAVAPTARVAVTEQARLATVSERTVTAATVRTGSASASSELTKARAILAGLIAKHPILKGTTVTFGDARGYQAIAYYKSGRIVISATHTATLERILNHEIWHVIDWRDNGRIDWGENVPPRQ
ncbi:MAG: hypothetical protein FDZ70_08485 [Actinobacteria bacterium]|nr:MAG: hypothetical protein FDZ70_08485 [Actinomycetota bacterium]